MEKRESSVFTCQTSCPQQTNCVATFTLAAKQKSTWCWWGHCSLAPEVCTLLNRPVLYKMVFIIRSSSVSNQFPGIIKSLFPQTLEQQTVGTQREAESRKELNEKAHCVIESILLLICYWSWSVQLDAAQPASTPPSLYLSIFIFVRLPFKCEKSKFILFLILVSLPTLVTVLVFPPRTSFSPFKSCDSNSLTHRGWRETPEFRMKTALFLQTSWVPVRYF